MMRSMTRWALAGSMALAAAGGVGGFGTGAATAHAAAIKSPFAGQYVGMVPSVASNLGLPWNIAISSSGGVKGSYSYRFRTVYRREHIDETHTYSGDFAGALDAAGGLEISGHQTHRVRDGTANLSYSTTTTFASSVSVVIDVNGNLVVTDGVTGTSEVWTRQ